MSLNLFGAVGPPDAVSAIELDLDLLRAADGSPFIATPDNATVLPSGRIAWTGRIAGVELSAVTFVIDRAAGTLTGSISYPGATFRIQSVGGGVHIVLKLDTSKFPDDVAIEPPGLPAAAAQPEQDGNAAATADDGSRIDVLVVYTPAARAAAGGTMAMLSLIDLAITETNQSYTNSGITPQVRLVGTSEVSYTESGDWITDINRLQNPADGVIDSVHTLRNTLGADVVSMIIEDTVSCGLAYTIGGPSTTYAPYAFTLVARSCATGYYSFGHEIGHIQGARHDWSVDETNNSPYTYNHGYYYSGVWRTIMSYANGCFPCTRIQYWSNPNIMYSGQALGVAEGGAYAADNRKTLNNTASSVANFRAEINSAPIAATLSSPSGAIGSTSPTYTWNVVSNSTWYYLWVTNSSGAPVIQQWYTSTQAACASTCSVTPGLTLSGGSYTWWIETWNASGYGPWSSSLSFVPSAIGTTLISPSGSVGTNRPTYSWNRTGASSYFLWVQNAAGTPLITTWYSASSVCGTTTCSVTPGVALAASNLHTWWVQTWSEVGYGPWSSSLSFTLTPPTVATLTSPTGSGPTSPTYTWNKVSTATSYYLWVSNAAGTPVIATWYSASVCGTTTCSVTPGVALAVSNLHTWWVQTWNEAGYGPWSASMSFTSALAAATLVSPLNNGTESSPGVTFQWNKQASATWYYLWIDRTTTGGVLRQWIEGSSVCGSSLCSLPTPVDLPSGTYHWWIQTWSPAGYGSWSTGFTFTVAAAPTSVVLTWNESPSDLDAHLLTPPIVGTSYHVYFGNLGSTTLAPYARLERDHVAGFGNETINVAQRFAGTYRYYVQNSSGTPPLAGSGALVRIYAYDTLVARVTAPVSGVGTYWRVCDFDGVTGALVTCPNTIGTSPPAFADGLPVGPVADEKPRPGADPAVTGDKRH